MDTRTEILVVYLELPKTSKKHYEIRKRHGQCLPFTPQGQLIMFTTCNIVAMFPKL